MLGWRGISTFPHPPFPVCVLTGGPGSQTWTPGKRQKPSWYAPHAYGGLRFSTVFSRQFEGVMTVVFCFQVHRRQIIASTPRESTLRASASTGACAAMRYMLLFRHTAARPVVMVVLPGVRCPRCIIISGTPIRVRNPARVCRNTMSTPLRAAPPVNTTLIRAHQIGPL